MEARTSLTIKLTMEEMLIRAHGSYENRIQINWNDRLRTRPNIKTVRPKVTVNIFEVLSPTDLRVFINDEELSEERFAESVKVNGAMATVTFKPNQKEIQEMVDSQREGPFVVFYDVDRSSLKDKQGGEVYTGNGYFVHFFATMSEIEIPPKHVAFLMDIKSHINSDESDYRAKVKRPMITLLNQLPPQDTFSLHFFNHNYMVRQLTTSTIQS